MLSKQGEKFGVGPAAEDAVIALIDGWEVEGVEGGELSRVRCEEEGKE